MRGDSLRDLYAKTLALVGLGLLGVAGAAVDYWPSGIQVPMVSTAFAGSSGLSALPVTDYDVPFRPAVAPARPVVMAAATPAVPVAEPVPTPPAPEQIVLTSSYDVEIGAAVALGTPPLPELVAPSALRTLPTTQIALSLPNALTGAIDGSDDGNDGGFFSDAGNFAKKAGSTILTGTVKAGAPFVGVAKLIGNAFKKIGLF